MSLWDKMTEGLQVFLAGSEWDQLPLLGFPASLQKPQTRQGDAWSLDLYMPFSPMFRHLSPLPEHCWADTLNCDWGPRDSRLIGGVGHRLRADGVLFLPLCPTQG